MTVAAENLLFVQALLAHLDRLEHILGDEWPYFREHLLELEEIKVDNVDEPQLTEWVDEILQLLLDSPASELARGLLAQAIAEAGELTVATRSVAMRDPTTGQEREIDLTTDGNGAAVSAGGLDVAAAMRAFSESLTSAGGRGLHRSADLLRDGPQTQKRWRLRRRPRRTRLRRRGSRHSARPSHRAARRTEPGGNFSSGLIRADTSRSCGSKRSDETNSRPTWVRLFRRPLRRRCCCSSMATTSLFRAAARRTAQLAYDLSFAGCAAAL